MKQPPNNLQVVIGRGDYSICEVSRRPIKKCENGYFPKGVFNPLKSERSETGQLPEKTFEDLFLFAAGEAIHNKEFQYHYFRQDFSATIEENCNNQPFRVSENCVKHFSIYGMDWLQIMGGKPF